MSLFPSLVFVAQATPTWLSDQLKELFERLTRAEEHVSGDERIVSVVFILIGTLGFLEYRRIRKRIDARILTEVSARSAAALQKASEEIDATKRKIEEQFGEAVRLRKSAENVLGVLTKARSGAGDPNTPIVQFGRTRLSLRTPTI